jgi:hypothetical protein
MYVYCRNCLKKCFSILQSLPNRLPWYSHRELLVLRAIWRTQYLEAVSFNKNLQDKLSEAYSKLANEHNEILKHYSNISRKFAEYKTSVSKLLSRDPELTLLVSKGIQIVKDKQIVAHRTPIILSNSKTLENAELVDFLVCVNIEKDVPVEYILETLPESMLQTLRVQLAMKFDQNSSLV